MVFSQFGAWICFFCLSWLSALPWLAKGDHNQRLAVFFPPWQPTVDGDLLPRRPLDLIRSGGAVRCPQVIFVFLPIGVGAMLFAMMIIQTRIQLP